MQVEHPLKRTFAPPFWQSIPAKRGSAKRTEPRGALGVDERARVGATQQLAGRVAGRQVLFCFDGEGGNIAQSAG